MGKNNIQSIVHIRVKLNDLNSEKKNSWKIQHKLISSKQKENPTLEIQMKWFRNTNEVVSTRQKLFVLSQHSPQKAHTHCLQAKQKTQTNYSQKSLLLWDKCIK